jgi:hypothetical protein
MDREIRRRGYQNIAELERHMVEKGEIKKEEMIFQNGSKKSK